jgi:ABC-type transporter Mla MlaB component
MSDACTLPSELTVYTVSELAPQCRAWLIADADDPATSLRVHAQAVSEVDAAGVQLLLSLANTLQANDRQLKLLQPSATLSAACQALGAGSLLDAQPAHGGAL